MSPTCTPAASSPATTSLGLIDSQTPDPPATNASTIAGTERCRCQRRRNAFELRCAGASPPSGTGSVWADRSSGPVAPVTGTIDRSRTPGADFGNRTIDDADWIESDMHSETQTPATCGYDPPLRGFTRAAVVELQRGQYRLRRLQQLAFDAQVTERTEVGPHRITAVEEGTQIALQLRRQAFVSTRCLGIVARDQQSQGVRESLDRVADAVDPLLTNRVFAELDSFPPRGAAWDGSNDLCRNRLRRKNDRLCKLSIRCSERCGHGFDRNALHACEPDPLRVIRDVHELGRRAARSPPCIVSQGDARDCAASAEPATQRWPGEDRAHRDSRAHH